MIRGGWRLASVLLAVCLALAQDAAPLGAGRWEVREIAGWQTQELAIAMKAGEFAGITLRHRGIDITARLIGPDGASYDLIVPELTGEEVSQGFVAPAAGLYHVRVKAPYQGSHGRYELRLDEIRAATEADRRLQQSATLAAEAYRFSSNGRYREALSPARHSAEIAEAELGSSSATVGFRLEQLGELYFHGGAYDQAESVLRRALEIDEQTVGREHPRCIAALAALAETYRAGGEFSKADPLLTRSLQTAEKVLGRDHPGLISPLIALANLQQARGDWARAEEDLQRALALAKRFLDADSLRALEAMNNLAVLYNSRGQYAKAEPLLNYVVEAEQRSLPPDSPLPAIPLWNLALIASDFHKDPHRALELYQKALPLLEKSVGSEQPQVLSVLNNVANIYKTTGDYTRALELHTRVHATLQQTLGPYHNLTLLSLGNIARTYASMGDVENSLKFQTLTDEAIEQNLALNLAAGSERQKLAYFDSLAERTDRTISLQVGLAPESQAAVRLAALAVLRRKGRVLDAMSLTLASLRERMDAQSRSLLDTWNQSTNQYARLALGGPGILSASTYRQRLEALAEQKDRSEAAISQRSAEFHTHSQPVTLEAVQAAIPPHTALIEFSTWRSFDPRRSNSEAYGERRYIAYVVNSSGAVQWKELGPAKEIDLAAAQFRQALRDPARKDVKEGGRALDRKIMEPLRTLAGDASRLLISPDGILNLVPFQALVDEHGAYLVERYSISYLTSGRDLLRLQARRPVHGPPLIFADPLFGEPPSQEGSKDLYFPPLPGTAREAQAIHALFPDARVLAGREATESALKLADAPAILHIATHGFFLPAQTDGSTRNPLLRSGLALAGANRDQGLFTALEASGLNLWGTELVNLSACDTGVGEVRDGEGVYGLRRAFVLAGAESLVMTLWPVGDYVTRQAMTAFYGSLKQGLGRAEALRQAQLEMLRQSGRDHPFYWAGFIQSGDWAPLGATR